MPLKFHPAAISKMGPSGGYPIGTPSTASLEGRTPFLIVLAGGRL